MLFSPNPIFLNSKISSNHSLNGGGIYIESDQSPIFDNTIFDGNIATESGGGIYIENDNPQISNIIIENNSAELVWNETIDMNLIVRHEIT